MSFARHILLFTIIPLLLFTAGYSYYRFIDQRDYTIEYEGECDPAAESCFIGCEDDACETTYTYKLIERHAADTYRLCGADITDCEAASACEPGEETCSVTYCDPLLEGDGCAEAGKLEIEEGPADAEPAQSSDEEPVTAEPI